ncbi:unnamed protein product [Meganyctiphanes norvegica]|uniref:Uncharacterized protein n=1 Tax=Meganyctiphanes norvegica TaxID=48144 RepID=A0AAV2QMK7_MEGNR
MDSTNPYRTTTTEDPEDEDYVDGQPYTQYTNTKTPPLLVVLGVFCMVMAVVQEAFYIMVISVSSNDPSLEEHAMPEMSTASAMAGVTAMFLALTARLLYLVLCHRSKDEITKARRWCWIASAVLIITHLLLCVWFGLNEDYAPLGLYLGTLCLYIVFCVVLKTHKPVPKGDDAHSQESQKL